jgi:hypothetical protein
VIEMLSTIAESNHSNALVVTNDNTEHGTTITPQRFYDLLGGVVRPDLLLRADLADTLEAFGHNKTYPGFTGSPDDLLEEYVKEGLQFLLESRGYRYGQNRLFESLPDGLVLARKPTGRLLSLGIAACPRRRMCAILKRILEEIVLFEIRIRSAYARRYPLFLSTSSKI